MTPAARVRGAPRARFAMPAMVIALAGSGFGLASGALPACSSATSPAPEADTPVELPDGTQFTRAGLLDAFATCALDHLRQFDAAAESLQAAAVAAEQDPTVLVEAQAQWRTAMDVWQRLELMQIGPAAPSTMPGGEGLRDAVYAWPLVRDCGIDEALLAPVDAEFTVTSAVANVRGLGAVEYALFAPAGDSACVAGSAPAVAWSELGPEAQRQRRSVYARAAAIDVRNAASTLYARWAIDGGDFATRLARAGRGNVVYSSQRIALNAVADGLFYLDAITKDLKIGRVAGVIGCDAASCPDAVESPHAGRSRVHVRNNLVGARLLLRGCQEDADGLGFDDWLVAEGAPAVAEELDATTRAALAAVDAVPEDDLAAAVRRDPSALADVHASLKQITDILKTDFISALDLELPSSVEGDND